MTVELHRGGVDDTFDVRRQAELLAVKWLHGLTNVNTRNAYARAIGLSPEIRTALPGGPNRALPPDGAAWIPWAITNGISPIGELEVEHAEGYAHALAPLKKNVRRQRWAALCSFYSYLRRSKLVYVDPNDLVNRKTMGLSGTEPTTTLALTPLQVRALFIAVQLDGTEHRVRNTAILAVISATGCRAEELVNLDVDSYRRESPRGFAWVLLDGKGDRRRWQKLPAADADRVDAYLQVRVPPATGAELTLPGQVSNRTVKQPLFTTAAGERLHEDTIAPLLQRIANLPQLDDTRKPVRDAARELAAVKDRLRPHQFRHAYAVTAEANGVPVTQIKADLGHASLMTTQNYLEAANVGRNSAAQVVSDIYHAGVVDLGTLVDDTAGGGPDDPAT